MGVTGSGKSTFISLLAEQSVQIGHSLNSCLMPPSPPQKRGYSSRMIMIRDRNLPMFLQVPPILVSTVFNTVTGRSTLLILLDSTIPRVQIPRSSRKSPSSLQPFIQRRSGLRGSSISTASLIRGCKGRRSRTCTCSRNCAEIAASRAWCSPPPCGRASTPPRRVDRLAGSGQRIFKTPNSGAP